MDPITQQQALAAAGAAGEEKLYVDDVFSTYVYEGTGTTNTITNGIDLAGEGGMVWCKGRDGAVYARIHDSERGVNASGYYNILRPDSTGAEITSFTNGINSFNSDGFTIQGGNSTINSTLYDYVSWTFRKAPGFFDVVTYTGNDSSGTYTTTQTISHNLEGSAGMVMVKPLSVVQDWYVNHDLSNPYVLKLNSSSGDATADEDFGFTGPGASSFNVKGPNTNANGVQYIAYVFARGNASNEIFGENGDESIIKTGSYTGNSSSDGPEINLGWEPQFVMIKRRNQQGDWMVFDTIRGMVASNSGGVGLKWNAADAEAGFGYVRPTATGFKLQTTSANVNSSSGNNVYVYMAIRRPHKPPTAGTDVFHVQTPREATDGTASQLVYTSNFPVDLSINIVTSGDALNGLTTDRMRGNKYLVTNSSAAEATSIWEFDSNEGVYFNSARSAASNQCGFLFRRAPKFLDIVAYEGTGSARTINHSLGAVPKMMIVKKRDTTESWSVYHEAYGNNKNIWLNDNSGGVTSARWNNTTPTDSVFSVGTDTGTNSSGADYIAYLFGDVPGISKVGSYTGTGNNIDVDCGFTAGARFVLIKRYGGTGEWYVWDTARGIVAGNESYNELNTTAADKTNFDYIDPLNAGFTVTSTANTDLNASGGTYLFLAIA